MGDATEIVRAAAEIAKVFSPITENLARLTGPACEEGGLYFGDLVRSLRTRNLSKIVDGSLKMLEDAGKPVNPVPPRLLIPIMDAASLEDDPTLQDMWSGLLASASDQADAMSPSYAETLKALAPIEARSLKALYDQMLNTLAGPLGSIQDVSMTLTFGLQLKVGEALAPSLIIEALERVGLLTREYDLHHAPAIMDSDVPANTFMSLLTPYARTMLELGRTRPFVDGDFHKRPALIYNLVFTSYGVQFMRACQGPMPQAPNTTEGS